MSYLGMSWDQGIFGYSLGNTMLAPNPNYPNCRTCTWNGDWDCPGMYGLSSYHPGGGNIAMADGSVRFLKSSTAMNLCGAWAPRPVAKSFRPTSTDPPPLSSVPKQCVIAASFRPQRDIAVSL